MFKGLRWEKETRLVPLGPRDGIRLTVEILEEYFKDILRRIVANIYWAYTMSKL